MQLRAGVGNFYRYAHPLIKMNKNLSFNFDLRLIFMIFFYSFFSENLLLLHGDIATNPGPNKNYFIEIQKLSTEISDMILERKEKLLWSFIFETSHQCQNLVVSPKIFLQWYQGPIDSSIISKQQNCIWFYNDGKSF